MRSKLENPILTLRLDLHLSDHCKSTRSHLISHLKNGPWDIPREFENELASNAKIFALKETDTTLCMSLKKILNALQNAQAGFSTVENIDITSSRSTAQIGKDLFREVYTNIDQVFDAIHEINHLVPEMKSLFFSEISELLQVAGTLANHFIENRQKFHMDTPSIYQMGKIVRKTRDIPTISNSTLVISAIEHISKFINDALFLLQSNPGLHNEAAYLEKQQQQTKAIDDLEKLFSENDLNGGFITNIKLIFQTLKTAIQSFQTVDYSNQLAYEHLYHMINQLRKTIFPGLMSLIVEVEIKLNLKNDTISQIILPHIDQIDAKLIELILKLNEAKTKTSSAANAGAAKVLTKILNLDPIAVNDFSSKHPELAKSYKEDPDFFKSTFDKLMTHLNKTTENLKKSYARYVQAEQFFKLVMENQDHGLAQASVENKKNMLKYLAAIQKSLIHASSLDFFETVRLELTGESSFKRPGFLKNFFSNPAKELMKYEKAVKTRLYREFTDHDYNKDRITAAFLSFYKKASCKIDSSSYPPELKLAILVDELSYLRPIEPENIESHPINAFPQLAEESQKHSQDPAQLQKILDKKNQLENDILQQMRQSSLQDFALSENPEQLIEKTLFKELHDLNLSQKISDFKVKLQGKLRPILRLDIQPILDKKFTTISDILKLPPTQSIYASLFYHLDQVQVSLASIQSLNAQEPTTSLGKAQFCYKLVDALNQISKSVQSIIDLSRHPSINAMIQELEKILKPYQKLLNLEIQSLSTDITQLPEKNIDVVWREQLQLVQQARENMLPHALQAVNPQVLAAPVDRPEKLTYDDFKKLPALQKIQEVEKLSIEDQIQLLTELPSIINPATGHKGKPGTIINGMELAKLVAASPIKLFTHSNSMNIFKDALGELIRSALQIPTAGFNLYKENANHFLGSLSNIVDTASIEMGVTLQSHLPFQTLLQKIEKLVIDIAISSSDINLWNEIALNQSISQKRARIIKLREAEACFNNDFYKQQYQLATKALDALANIKDNDLNDEVGKIFFLTQFQLIQKWLFRIDPASFDITFFVRQLKDKENFLKKKKKILHLRDEVLSHIDLQIKENTRGSIKHREISDAIMRLEKADNSIGTQLIASLDARIDADLSISLPKNLELSALPHVNQSIKAIKDDLKKKSASIISDQDPEKKYQQLLKNALDQIKAIRDQVTQILKSQDFKTTLEETIQSLPEPKPPYATKVSELLVTLSQAIIQFDATLATNTYKTIILNDDYIKLQALLKIKDLEKSLKADELTERLKHAINSWKDCLSHANKSAQELLTELHNNISHEIRTNQQLTSLLSRLIQWIESIIRKLVNKKPLIKVEDKLQFAKQEVDRLKSHRLKLMPPPGRQQSI
jgi:hypothetical protein